MHHAGDEGPSGAPRDETAARDTKNGAVVAALELLGDDRPHEAGERISEQALGEHHQIEQRI